MIQAIMTKTENLAELGCTIVFTAGERQCGIIEGTIDTPDGCMRIPLSTLQAISHKHDVQWLIPNTATVGQQRTREKIAHFVGSFVSGESSTTSTEYHPSLLSGGTMRRNGLLDVHSKRKRLERRGAL